MKFSIAILAVAGIAHAGIFFKEPRAASPTNPFDGIASLAAARGNEINAINPFAEINGRSPVTTVTRTSSTITTITDVVGFGIPTNRPQDTGRPNICQDVCDIYYGQCMQKCEATKSSASCKDSCVSYTCYFGAGGGQTCGMCGYIIGNCGTVFSNIPQS